MAVRMVRGHTPLNRADSPPFCNRLTEAPVRSLRWAAQVHQGSRPRQQDMLHHSSLVARQAQGRTWAICVMTTGRLLCRPVALVSAV